MSQLTEITKAIGAMPIDGLAALIILGGFALAGFAIYAVLTISRERSNGAS
jgi:hypothetical protein